MNITAPVFDVQRFSLHDGPGIRTLVFLKGCALHCPWCQNPESQDHRPIVAFYAKRCEENFECSSACPELAIQLSGFRIDQSKCTHCGQCVDACPSGALRLVGEELTPEQLMEKVRADLPYYEGSNGGVTFTGGEPTLHPAFLERVIDLCRRESISTNLETAGVFSLNKWAPILAKLDLIYFDLKIMDAEQHSKHLGGSYDTIKSNAAGLVKMGLPVEFRMPVTPGFTDSQENIGQIACFLKSLGKTDLHLLQYHNMGETKIDIIRGTQPCLGLERLSDERFEEVRNDFRRLGITVLNPD